MQPKVGPYSVPKMRVELETVTAINAQKVQKTEVPKQQPGVVGLAPTKPITPLEAKSLDTALSGVASSLIAASKRGDAPLASALKQATQQLNKLDAGQIAALPEDARLQLSVKLGEAFHQASRAATGPMAKGQLEALERAAGSKLGALPIALAQLEGRALPSGPGLTQGLSASQLSLLSSASPAEQKILGELLAANPHAPSAVLDLLDSSPTREKSVAKLALMFPGADALGGMEKLRGDLSADLKVGDLETKMRKHLEWRGVSAEDIKSFFDVLAETRGAFAAGAPGDDMQRTNWIHTRVELLHTLEAATKLKLDPMETKAALYGALFSDSFKDAGPYSVAWHNRPGAELAAPLVMSRHLDLSKPENQQLLDWSMRVAHEHQITPPLFMSGALGGVLAGHLKSKSPEDQKRLQPFVDEIKAKTFKPLEAEQKDGEIVFSKGAQALLREVGVPGWAVTHDAPWARASQAAILGDVWQYASPDGLIKYGHDLRDPGHPVPMFRDPVISMDFLRGKDAGAAKKLEDAQIRTGAIESSLDFSLGQGASVISDASLKQLLDDEQKAMRSILKTRVYPEVDKRLREALKLGADDPIPYWSAPVSTAPDYTLTPREREVATLVKKTFEKVMSEVGGVPLDPFASRKS